jgi:hypothetical protein
MGHLPLTLEYSDELGEQAKKSGTWQSQPWSAPTSCGAILALLLGDSYMFGDEVR